jgi:hypothetical protein
MTQFSIATNAATAHEQRDCCENGTDPRPSQATPEAGTPLNAGVTRVDAGGRSLGRSPDSPASVTKAVMNDSRSRHKANSHAQDRTVTKGGRPQAGARLELAAGLGVRVERPLC